MGLGDVVTPNLTEACILTDRPYRREGWTIRELDDRATAVRDLSWLESGALLHITYETEKDGTLTVDFVPDAELTDPGDLCGYPAE